MDSTDFLAVRGVVAMQDDEIYIHPNDGYDLGLMMDKYPVKIYLNIAQEKFSASEGSFTDGHILLKNECKTGTMELSNKQCQILGNPKMARLFLADGRVLISL